MRLIDLKGKHVAIWGTGREGQAAAELIAHAYPEIPLVFIDEKDGDPVLSLDKEYPVIREKTAVMDLLARTDVLIKSPGVSLYHPMLESAKGRGLVITSLLNLWCAENVGASIIGITGTKGKSTTSTLLAHVMNALGLRTGVLGNIGVPVTKGALLDVDHYIVEISSYQAANFDGLCRVGILTSLYPEHLDWHHSLKQYYVDKCNLLRHSKIKVLSSQVRDTVRQYNIDIGEGGTVCDGPQAWHFRDDVVFFADRQIGKLQNKFLLREHNRHNVCLVLEALRVLNADCVRAIEVMESYKGLPHREQEVGIRNGVLYIDDSISTTPQSAIAALEAYALKPVTLIAGGFDRGIDYAPLVDYVRGHALSYVVCMGKSGQRIFKLLEDSGYTKVAYVQSMEEAVALARRKTPHDGAILLSPASPSYDMYEDYIARAAAFMRAAGF